MRSAFCTCPRSCDAVQQARRAWSWTDAEPGLAAHLRQAGKSRCDVRLAQLAWPDRAKCPARTPLERKDRGFSEPRPMAQAMQSDPSMWWPLKIGLVCLVYGWTALIIVFMAMGLQIAWQLRRRASSRPPLDRRAHRASRRRPIVVRESPKIVRGDWRPRRGRLGFRLLYWVRRRPLESPREVARRERERIRLQSRRAGRVHIPAAPARLHSVAPQARAMHTSSVTEQRQTISL